MNKGQEQIINPCHIITIHRLLFEIQNNKIGTVFFDYHGHVNAISIKIYCPFWEANSDPSFECNAYLENTSEISNVIKNLIRLKLNNLNKSKMAYRKIEKRIYQLES